ncbi:MAG: TIGR03936 family radical SAM-associated protein, partial [Deltaproteobacteria bacterium]|nr:TIGR03936 family radical SAM-associated protein [Deltaproteobacteria bacterium]
NECIPRHVSLSLPSLRVETLTSRMADSIKRVRKTSFTLAPEAGTQRLRNIINKGNTEDDLLASVNLVAAAGWKGLKLYFMIGLPGETESDVEGIAATVKKIASITKNRIEITASLSTFVPKPHTPFQWCRQIDMEETVAKQERLKKLRGGNISVKWHDKRMSFLEGFLCRADRYAGKTIEEAFRLGCRFDGWTDNLHFALWQTAMENNGVDPVSFLSERPENCPFPWDIIDCGVSRDYLRSEYLNAFNEIATPDCRHQNCNNCGVCNGKDIQMSIALAEDSEQELQPAPPQKTGEFPYRIAFTKLGVARFLSHLEMSSTLARAFRRVSNDIAYSQGFHPQARISFAFATAVGMASLEEFADVTFTKDLDSVVEIMARINHALPAGLAITQMIPIAPHSTSLARRISAFEYRITLDEEVNWEGILEKAAEFSLAPEFLITREREGKKISRNAKELVELIIVLASEQAILMRLAYQTSGTIKPSEVLTEILGISSATSADILKTKTFFKQ